MSPARLGPRVEEKFLMSITQINREQTMTTNLACSLSLYYKVETIMAYSDYLCELDQEYRELLDRLADEWRVNGETDGGEGVDPEYLNNSAYMAGYDAGRSRYIKRANPRSLRVDGSAAAGWCGSRIASVVLRPSTTSFRS